MNPFRYFALITAFVASGQIVPAIVIDDFSQGALFLQMTNTGQTLYQIGLNTSDVIGGSRSVYVASSGGTASAEIDASAGQFLFSTDLSTSGYFTLEYGATTPLNANLTADGSDRFRINISTLTPGHTGTFFLFGVETGSAWSYYDFANDLLSLNGPGILTIPFSNFAGMNMANVKTVLIGAVRFEPGSEIGIASVTTIPEPPLLALFVAAGSLAYAFKPVRRRIKSLQS